MTTTTALTRVSSDKQAGVPNFLSQILSSIPESPPLLYITITSSYVTYLKKLLHECFDHIPFMGHTFALKILVWATTKCRSNRTLEHPFCRDLPTFVLSIYGSWWISRMTAALYTFTKTRLKHESGESGRT